MFSFLLHSTEKVVWLSPVAYDEISSCDRRKYTLSMCGPKGQDGALVALGGASSNGCSVSTMTWDGAIAVASTDDLGS